MNHSYLNDGTEELIDELRAKINDLETREEELQIMQVLALESDHESISDLRQQLYVATKLVHGDLIKDLASHDHNIKLSAESSSKATKPRNSLNALYATSFTTASTGNLTFADTSAYNTINNLPTMSNIYLPKDDSEEMTLYSYFKYRLALWLERKEKRKKIKKEAKTHLGCIAQEVKDIKSNE